MLQLLILPFVMAGAKIGKLAKNSEGVGGFVCHPIQRVLGPESIQGSDHRIQLFRSSRKPFECIDVPIAPAVDLGEDDIRTYHGTYPVFCF